MDAAQASAIVLELPVFAGLPQNRAEFERWSPDGTTGGVFSTEPRRWIWCRMSRCPRQATVPSQKKPC